MKVGIVTIYDLDNYGNRLQNYATVKYLEQLGISAETLIINEHSVVIWSKNIIKKLSGKKPYIHWNLKQECDPRINGWSEEKKKKYYAFYEFSHKYTNIKYVNYFHIMPYLLDKEYDYFIAGSDQVWNPTIGQAVNWEFLSFAQRKKKVSWAASFGINSIPENEKNYIKKWLSKFDNISIREDSGAKIVKSLTGKSAEVLIDPTLMLDAEQWRQISKKSCGRNTDKYILKYFLGDQSAENKKYIDEIAKENVLEIYELADINQPLIYEAGPSEFIDLIYNAELVCTDSFHACVFSILFNKPFLVFERNGRGSGMGSRIKTLLTRLGLERKMPGCVDKDGIFENDYTHTHQLLISERKKTEAFLNKSLR